MTPSQWDDMIWPIVDWPPDPEQISHVITLAIAAERETCAQMLEALADDLTRRICEERMPFEMTVRTRAAVAAYYTAAAAIRALT
jgi:hypothetical protein